MWIVEVFRKTSLWVVSAGVERNFPDIYRGNEHTYAFLMFSSKNVALAVEMEIPGFRENLRFSMLAVYFHGRHGQTYMGF